MEQRIRDLQLETRVRLVGSRPRDEVLRYLAGARAAVLSSAWENLPHAAVEALAVGTPVVATAVGGVPEVVHDDVNGLLVPPNDPAALAAAIRRVLDDSELRDRLAAGAQPSVAAIGREPIYSRLEAILVGGGALTPRALFVGRSRIAVPLDPWLAKKWDAVGEQLDIRVLTTVTGSGGDERFSALPDPAPLFYAALVPETARALRTFKPDVIVATDPFVAAGALAARRLARSHAKVIVEVHGDPMTFTRLYGSPARRAVSLPADRLAHRSLVRADATRALSAFTSSVVERTRGVPATACFPTYSDLSAFADTPLASVPDGAATRFRRRARGVQERARPRCGVATDRRSVTRRAPDDHR